MATEAQKKAIKKYKEKLNRLTVDFSPAEADLWEHINAQPKKQTYIKDLIRKDMEDVQWIKYSSDEWICPACGYSKYCDTLDGGELPPYCEECGKRMKI